MRPLSMVVVVACAVAANIGPPQLANGTAVFYDGLNGSKCFRIPTIIQTHTNTLLAFAENRITDCGDNGAHHALVLRRSDDGGKNWGPMITVMEGEVPCPGCPAAISNPNPVEITMPDGSKSILLHYDTMNNPNPSHHGLDMQMWSHDDGLTWSNGTVLAYPPVNNTGALIGPSVGIQSKSGIIYFNAAFEHKKWLYWSKDYGATWKASEVLMNLGECSIAFLVDAEDGRIIMVIFSPEGVPGRITYPDGLIDPGCQGSVVNGGDGSLYTSNANTTNGRTHMTVKQSSDQGKSWNSGTVDMSAVYSHHTMFQVWSIGFLTLPSLS